MHSFMIPQMSLPMARPSLYNLNHQHPTLQLPPPTLSLCCQRFLSPTALDWKVMIHPFNHPSAFTLNSLPPVSSRARLSPTRPWTGNIEPAPLVATGESTHPGWLVLLEIHDWVPTSRGYDPCYSPSLVHSLYLIPPSLSHFQHVSPSCLSADNASFFMQKLNGTRRTFPHPPLKTLRAYLPLSACTSLCSPEWTLPRASSSPWSTEFHSCLSTQENHSL